MPAPDRLLRLRDVAFLVGMSKATIYRKLKVGDFPRPVSSGASVRWKESDISGWIASLTTRAA